MPNTEIDSLKSLSFGSGIDEDDNADYSEGVNYIIAIGIDNYEKADLKLNSCANDCNAIVQTLTKDYSFKVFDEPLLNEKAKRKGILDLLEKFRKFKPTQNDSLILFFSGHGHLFSLPGNEKIGCWVPQDAIDQELKNLLKLPDIIDEIKQLDIRHVVIVSDCCHSGAILEQPFFYNSSSKVDPHTKLRFSKSRWAICSSRSNEPSIAGNTNQLSRFTERFLLELNKNSDEDFYLSGLLANMKGYFDSKGWQNPYGKPLDIIENNGGEFVFKKKKDIITISNREKILTKGLMLLNYNDQKKIITKINNSKNDIEARGSKCVTFISGTPHCGLPFVGYFVKKAIFGKDVSVNPVSPANLYAEGQDQILHVFNSALRINVNDAEALKKTLIAKLSISDVVIEIKFNTTNALLEKMKIDLVNNILEFLTEIKNDEHKLHKLLLIVVDEERVDFEKSKWKQFESNITSFVIPKTEPIKSDELSTWYDTMKNNYADFDDDKANYFEELFAGCLSSQINSIYEETNGYPGKVITAICDKSGCYTLSDKFLNR